MRRLLIDAVEGSTEGPPPPLALLASSVASVAGVGADADGVVVVSGGEDAFVVVGEESSGCSVEEWMP